MLLLKSTYITLVLVLFICKTTFSTRFYGYQLPIKKEGKYYSKDEKKIKPISFINNENFITISKSLYLKLLRNYYNGLNNSFFTNYYNPNVFGFHHFYKYENKNDIYKNIIGLCLNGQLRINGKCIGEQQSNKI